MSYIDLLLAVPLLWGLVRGYMKGFIVSVSSLIALILGVYGAILFSDRLGLHLQEAHGLDGPFMPAIAFSLVFLAIVVGVYFLGRAVQKVVHMAALGFFNKLAGALFGFLKSLLILSVIILLLEKADEYFQVLPEEEIAGSLLYPFVSDVMQEYFPLVAESRAFQELTESAGEMREELEKSFE
jgi:membrane protein required for colicin V production